MSASPTIHVPSTLPVMVLSNCTLFPHSLLPLFIFEQRYREMLAYALENHRMFCLGNLASGPQWSQEDESDERIHTLTTAGVVRACVGRPDGTSHLMLQGVTRLKIVGWEQREPFRIARVEVIPSILGNEAENGLAAERLLSLVLEILKGAGANGHQLATQIKTLKNPDVIADFVAANFLGEPANRQQALEIPDVGKRLNYLLTCLGE